MSATPESEQEVRQLFRQHVPEVSAGAVEIVRVARDVGRRSYVAVRSHEAGVDPVRACAGVRGTRLKAMGSDFKGEYFTIVRWDESPERFIGNAVGGLRRAEVVLDRAAGVALVTIDPPGPSSPDVGLIAQLTGWKITLHTREA